MNCCILMGWEIIMQNSLDSFLFKVLIFYKKNIDNSNTEDKSEKEFRKMLSKIIGNDRVLCVSMGTYESLGKKEDMLSLRIHKIIDVLIERKDIGEAKVEYEVFLDKFLAFISSDENKENFLTALIDINREGWFDQEWLKEFRL